MYRLEPTFTTDTAEKQKQKRKGKEQAMNHPPFAFGRRFLER
jgi:hypothetical protein